MIRLVRWCAYFSLLFIIYSPIKGEKLIWKPVSVEIHNPPNSVCFYREIYYLSVPSGVQIARLDANAQRTILKTISVFPHYGRLFVYGQYLLVPMADRVAIFSLEDPENPQLVNLAQAETSYAMCLDGNRLYFHERKGIGIYSLASLPNLIRVGDWTVPLTEQPNEFNSFTVRDGVLYELIQSSILYIADVNDSINPTLIDTITAPSDESWDCRIAASPNWLFLSGERFSAAGQDNIVKAFPLQPNGGLGVAIEFNSNLPIVEFYQAGSWMLGIDVLTKDIYFFDMMPPDGPVFTTSWPLKELGGDDLFGVNISFCPPFLFLSFNLVCTKVLQTASLPEQALLTAYDAQPAQYASSVCSDGDIVAVEGYRTDNFNITWLFRIFPDGTLILMSTLPGMVAEGLKDGVLYAGDTTTGDLHQGGNPLHLFDVSDPAHPQSLGLVPGIYGMRMRIQGNYCIALDNEIGSILLDVTNPRQPVEICRWRPDDHFTLWDGWVERHYLYLTDIDFHENGQCIWVVDFRNPVHPILVQQFDNRWGMDFYIPLHCNVYSSEFLLVNEIYAVDVIDITKLDNPRLLYSIHAPLTNSPTYGVEQITISGHHLFGAWRGSGICVHDLELPWEDLAPDSETPLVGQFLTTQSMIDIWADDSRICVVTQPHVVSIQYRILPDGDVNEDGFVDSLDLILLKLWLVEEDAMDPDPAVADLDRDGRIGILDALNLAMILVS